MRLVVALLVFFNGFLLSDTYNAERHYSSNTLNRIIKVDTRLAETVPLISSRSISNNDDGNHGSPINSPKSNSVENKRSCAVGKTFAERSCSRNFQQCIPPGRLLWRRCSENYRFDGSIKRCRLLSQMPGCSKNPVLHFETKHHAPTKTIKTVVDTVEYLLPEQPRVLYMRPAFDAFAVPTYPAGGDPFVYNAPAYPAQHSFNTRGPSPWQSDAFKAYIPPKSGFSPFGTPFYIPNVHDAFDVPHHRAHPYFQNSVPKYGEYQRDGVTWINGMRKPPQESAFVKIDLFEDTLGVSPRALKEPETVTPQEQSGTDGTAGTEKKIDVPRTEDGLESEKSALPVKTQEDTRQAHVEGNDHSNQPKAEGDTRQGEEDGQSNQPKAEEDNRQDQDEGDGHNSQLKAEGDNRQDQDEGDGHSNQTEEDERRDQPTASETTKDRTGSDKLASPSENDVTHLSRDKPVLPEVKPVGSLDRNENFNMREQDQESSESDPKGAMQNDEENEGSSENTEPPQLPDHLSSPPETTKPSGSQNEKFELKFKDLALKEEDETRAPETKDEVLAPEKSSPETDGRLPDVAVDKAAEGSITGIETAAEDSLFAVFKTTTEDLPHEAVKTTTEGLPDEGVQITTEGLPDEAVKTTTEGLPDEAVTITTEGLPDEAVKTTTGSLPVELFTIISKEDDDIDQKQFNKTMDDADAEVDKTMNEETSLNKRDRRDVSVVKDTSEQAYDAGNKVSFLPDPDDCRRFYVLIMGKWIPFTCSGWTVFNPATGLCDLPENVPSCEVWNP